MKYDFDTFVERHGTRSIKFDFAVQRGHSPEELSYWVADMDFKTAPQILDALKERIDHGIFGYTDPDSSYFEAVHGWYKNHFGYETKQEWLKVTPGIVFAIAAAIQAYTLQGEAVLVNSPVYYPFSETVRVAGRKLVSSDLVFDGEKYNFDFADFEEKIQSNNVKLWLLCNPHNPGGRSWTFDELKKAGEICLKYGVKILSDEIHSDFVWNENKHTVFASISPEFEAKTITCTAPTKTFNLAGLQVSNIFISDEKLRAAFTRAMDILGYSQPNVLGLAACQAAYKSGEDWLNQVKEYISENLDRATEYINKNLPGAKALKPQATYLLWVDCHGLGYSDEKLNRKIREEAKLWLDEGNIFGESGKCFERINVATSWTYLEKGLERFVKALRN